MAKKKEIETVALHIGTEEEVKSALEIAIKEEAITLVEKAQEYKVIDQASYIRAGEFIAGCQEVRKKIVNFWKPLKEAAFRAHKGITQSEKSDLDPIDAAVLTVSNEISRHLKAEAEKEKERQRQALIEAGKKEDERRKAEKEEADKLKAEGKEEDIWDTIAKNKVEVKPVIMELPFKSEGAVSTNIKTDNLTMRVKPDIEVTLIKKSLLVRAVLAGKIPHDVLVVDLVFAKRWIKENDIKEIDGLKIEEVFKAKVR